MLWNAQIAHRPSCSVAVSVNRARLHDAYGWSLDAIEAWHVATNRGLLLRRT